ncbi:hypothetical protein HWV62_31115 [Athelia sp. TMB]|nr:hypothetical protein HWV62_31115 [Athelia sp. TMB]
MPAGIDLYAIAVCCLLTTCLPAAAQQCQLKMPVAAIAGKSSPGISSITSSSTTRLSISTAAYTTTSSAPSASSSSQAANTTFAYGTAPVRGVNLGGWFVLEPWITPSVFENTNNTNVIDEYTLGQNLGPDAALEILQAHWETWITEQDFVDIAAAGLNHVRIPLGYWSIPLTAADTNQSTNVAPYTPGAWPYFLQALAWAHSNSIHVILDLHGAPGSQNGYDNSGQHTNNPVWAINAANVSRTLDIIAYLAKNVGDLVDVIELLNEPAAFKSQAFAETLRQYWSDGYDAVRNWNGDVKVMIGNGFLPLTTWGDFLTYPGSQGVLMDYHEYQIFSDDQLSRSFSEHISFACQMATTLSSFASSNLYTVMGVRLPDGDYPFLIRLEQSIHRHGSYKTFLGQYWQAQVEAAENVQGWVFWTWKAENADEWSYQEGIVGGWIPQDAGNRLYPSICT